MKIQILASRRGLHPGSTCYMKAWFTPRQHLLHEGAGCKTHLKPRCLVARREVRSNSVGGNQVNKGCNHDIIIFKTLSRISQVLGYLTNNCVFSDSKLRRYPLSRDIFDKCSKLRRYRDIFDKCHFEKGSDGVVCGLLATVGKGY